MKTKTLVVTVAITALLGSHMVEAKQQDDTFIRLGVTHIAPKSDNGTLIGTDLGVDVKSATGISFDFTRMLSNNWGVELLASLPFSHDISVDTLGHVGSTKHLPPTLSLQYHFNPAGKISPYVGAGLNFTIFFDEKTRGALEGSDLSLKTSAGPAANFGIDFAVTERVFLNANVRYINIESDAKLDGVKIAKVKIDPWTAGLNFGWRF